MKEKVCHITSAHRRYDLRILKKECVSLAKEGYEVSLLVFDDLPDEDIDNVRIISVGDHKPNRVERIKSGKKILKKALILDSRIYHLHDPELLWVGMKLRKQGKIVIFDSHEDVPVQIMDKTYIPKAIRKLISYLYENYEKMCFKKFNGLISVTPHIVDRLKRINKNTEMITNYPIVVLEEADESFKDRKVICFVGGITYQWNLEIILEAIEEMEGIELVLAGNANYRYLELLKNMRGWSKVTYLGNIPHSEVKSVYAKSCIGMALNESSQLRDYGSLGNTKIFEYMSAALPIICTNYPLWKEIVQINQCGICVDPRNKAEVKNAIEMLLSDVKFAQKAGNNGLLAIQREYNWKTQEKKLVDFYQKLLNNENN